MVLSCCTHQNYVGGGGGEWWLRRRERDRTDEILRYFRQILLLGGFGVLVQRKILSLLVQVVGAGIIGTNLLLLLAARGVGRITVVYHNNMEVYNLP